VSLLARALDRLEEILVSVLLVAASLLTFVQVVMRYGLGTTFPWGEELIINMLIWGGLIGSSLALRMGIHIGVDIFVKKFPPPVAKALTLLGLGLGLGFCAILAVLSVRFVLFQMRGGQMSIGLEIPMWIPYLCLPIAFGLMTIRFLQIIGRCWRDQPLYQGDISVEEIR
jgi:TRAP-type C4-dicarboxylate transport system permease small subunit